tara:strand:- start:991 stop:1464 length:474 start_codon:yes stop_codon:yes gene_type:complete
MAFIDVITLAQAKEYLRVDDDLTEDNASITIMINTALKYVEDYTNVLVYARNVNYRFINGCKNVYTYPINSAVSPVLADMTVKNYTLYTSYSYGSDNTVLTLNVGHLLPADVPDDLRSVALEMIDLLYYEHESGKSFPKDVSSLSKAILDQSKRFII